MRVGRSAGETFDEHRAERVDVSGRPDSLALDVLGRDVVDGSQELAAAGEAGRAEEPAQAEVRQVDVLVLVDENVGRLDIAVHEPAPMGGVERLRCLA